MKNTPLRYAVRQLSSPMGSFPSPCYPCRSTTRYQIRRLPVEGVRKEIFTNFSKSPSFLTYRRSFGKIPACGTKGIEGSPHRGGRHFLWAVLCHSGNAKKKRQYAYIAGESLILGCFTVIGLGCLNAVRNIDQTGPCMAGGLSRKMRSVSGWRWPGNMDWRLERI